MSEYRLGDIIDDYCVRCKRIMNHAVVSVLNREPAKVRCRTCHSDHDYRHEQVPPSKVDLRKAALFQEVLKVGQPRRTPRSKPPCLPTPSWKKRPRPRQRARAASRRRGTSKRPWELPRQSIISK